MALLITAAPPTGLNSWVGVPDPTSTTTELEALGYEAWATEPRTRAAPSRPDPWTSNQTGFYYISNTGTNSGNGYPGDPAGPGDIPTAPPAGSLIVIDGHVEISGTLGLTWSNGTEANPIFLVGNTGRDTDRLSFSGSNNMGITADHMYMDGLTVNRRGSTRGS